MISPRFVIRQSWRQFNTVSMGKWIQVGAPEAGEWSGEHLLSQGMVYREGRKPERFGEWFEREWRRLEAKGYVPEVHVCNCWVLGGDAVSYDLVLDLEPAPLEEQISRVINLLGFLHKYGVKAAAKVSSLRDMNTGFHIYADLSQLWGIVEEKWSEFYASLVRYVERVFGVKLDPAFGHKHQYRAFASPREEKGDPTRLNCYNNWLPWSELVELSELGRSVGWSFAQEALAVELSEPLERLPATGVYDSKLFLDAFESLTSLKLENEARREAEKRVLPMRKVLFRSSSRHRWIERVLNLGLEDGRKRFVVFCAAPYLARHVKAGLLTEEEALQKLLQFTQKKGEKIRESQLRAWLKWALKKERKPLSMTRFLERFPDLEPTLKSLFQPSRESGIA